MANRTANYTAFYVNMPFSPSNLGANATRDFVYYNQLRQWKGADGSFPFIDAHAKTYNVRDGSSWETLRRRLHERLDCSKNIVLLLSSITKSSDALKEEIDYGINVKGLPVIVIYPDFKRKSDICCSTGLRKQVTDLWDKIPVFRDSMQKVATLHVPYKKVIIAHALQDKDYMVQTMARPGRYCYKL